MLANFTNCPGGDRDMHVTGDPLCSSVLGAGTYVPRPPAIVKPGSIHTPGAMHPRTQLWSVSQSTLRISEFQIRLTVPVYTTRLAPVALLSPSLLG